MLKFAKILFVVVLLPFGAFVSEARATATLSLSSSGGGVYQISGSGLEGAAGFDVTVAYDSSALSSPQVSQASLLSGAMTAVNVNTPGIIRINAVTISAVKGSGQLFTITFTGQSDGGIVNFTARLIDSSGKTLSSQTQISTSAARTVRQDRKKSTSKEEESSQESGSEESKTASGTASGTETGSGTGTGTIIGYIVPPPTGEIKPAEQPATTTDRTPVPEPEPQRTEPESKAAQPASGDRPQTKTRTVYTQPSIADLFRDFKGERTMKACLDLFRREPLIGFLQEPAVALADGSTQVSVRFISLPDRQSTSDVALMGAKVVSSRREPEATNTWIVTILPDKGADRAALSVPQKDLMTVFPITVAPKANIDLDRSGSVTEADFHLFLREQSVKKAPKFDLNGDGKRDYLDDYIFTANYLIAVGKK